MTLHESRVDAIVAWPLAILLVVLASPALVVIWALSPLEPPAPIAYLGEGEVGPEW